VDLCDLALLLALALGLADVAAQLSLGDVNASLVSGSFMGLAAERLEVDRVGGVFELFDLLGGQFCLSVRGKRG
jgi:hypothetical protein